MSSEGNSNEIFEAARYSHTEAFFKLNRGLEFMVRGLLVNIPTYLLAHFVELDRVSIVVMAYFLLQVVGLCWAILLNAGFSLACRITNVLPYIESSVLQNTATQAASSFVSGDFTTSVSVQMISTFYVSYASVRSVISFSSSIFNLALDSMNNFPVSAAAMVKRGEYLLDTSHWCFLPALVLLLGLAGSDNLCYEYDDLGNKNLVFGAIGGDDATGQCEQGNATMAGTAAAPALRLLHRGARFAQLGVCNHVGFRYLTSQYQMTRRLLFYTMMIMVIQLWQAYLHQFPRWDLAFRTASSWKRVSLQTSVVILFAISCISGYLVFFTSIKTSNAEEIVCLVLLGWTLWLFAFAPVLAGAHGHKWLRRLSCPNVQQFASYIRISQTCLLGVIFISLCASRGFVAARMDLTFITILLPTLYSCAYLLASMYMRASKLLLIVGTPLAAVASLVITMYLAKAGGDGCFLLVFFHIMGKWVEFFGSDSEDEEEEEDKEGGDSSDDVEGTGQGRGGRQGGRHHPPGRDLATITISTISTSTSTSTSTSSHHEGNGNDEGSGVRRVSRSSGVQEDGSPEGHGQARDIPPSPGPTRRYRFYTMYAENQVPVPAGEGKHEDEGEEDRGVGVVLEEGEETEFAVAEGEATGFLLGGEDAVDISLPGVGSATEQQQQQQQEDSPGDQYTWRSRAGSALSPDKSGVPDPDPRFSPFTSPLRATSQSLQGEAATDTPTHGKRVVGNRPRAGSSFDDSDIKLGSTSTGTSHGGSGADSKAQSKGKGKGKGKGSDAAGGGLDSDLFSPVALRAVKSADYMPPQIPWQAEYEGTSSGLRGLLRQDTSYAALQLLENRKEEDSTLVSIHLPPALESHWLRKFVKKNMTFYWRIARSIAGADTVYSGVLRAFTSLAVILTLMLTAIAIVAHVQKAFEIFPELIKFTHDKQRGRIHFDHVISNVTFATLPPMSHRNHSGEGFTQQEYSHTRANTNAAAGLKSPWYSVCGWKWNDMSVLDFALLSEAAYFDDDGHGNLQSMVHSLFPHRAFTVTSSHSPSQLYGGGPRYIEVSSDSGGEQGAGFTVLAVRGTDVGKFHDLMEDFMLYSEPIIFSLLSTVFPTIRIWTHETTAHIIEWLYEFNSFFGLQGEAEYYGPLTQRVFEIANKAEGHQVIITGHSLGGGLARIVGTLAGQGSVSFSPPGLGQSYRKYSLAHSANKEGARTKDKDKNKAKALSDVHNSRMSRGQMHHLSLAIVPEYDLFTQIDEQVGSVQNIQCDRDNTFFCHLMEGTMCHLLQHCGDEAGRFASCETNIDLGVVAPSMFDFIWKNRIFTGPIILLFALMVLLAVLPDMI
jgi:hypothetical protein